MEILEIPNTEKSRKTPRFWFNFFLTLFVDNISIFISTTPREKQNSYFDRETTAIFPTQIYKYYFLQKKIAVFTNCLFTKFSF